VIEYADPKAIPLPQSKRVRMSLWLARNAAAMFVALAAAGAAFAAVAFTLRSPLLSCGAAMTVVVLSVCMSQAIQINRRARAMLILEYLEQAVRLDLPLSEMLHASSLGERRPMSARLSLLAGKMEGGASIAEALQSVPEMPAREIGLVATASHANALAPTLSRILEEDRNQITRDAYRGVFLRLYAVITVSMVAVVIVLFCIFVLPKFESIFADFHVKLPWQTHFLRDVGIRAAPIVAVIAVLSLLAVYSNAWHNAFDIKVRRAPLLSGLRQRIQWYLPIVGGLVRDRGFADICFTLSYSMKAGMPLETALVEAASIPVNIVLRGRLMDWMAGMARGQEIAAAARAARMPALMVGMLGPGTASASIPQVLQFLARYYRSRAHRTWHLLQAAMVPITVFLVGAAVLLVVMAVIAPLFQLTEHIADEMSRRHL
jgi:type II secretory pathway component PulF